MQEAQTQQQKQEILKLADNMAEAATDFKGQNYVAFIQSRESLINFLNKIQDIELKSN